MNEKGNPPIRLKRYYVQTHPSHSLMTNTQVTSRIWYFGDDSITVDVNPFEYIYLNTGTYTVSCKITYADNATDSTTQQITVYSELL